MFKQFFKNGHCYTQLALSMINLFLLTGLIQAQAQNSPKKWSAVQKEVWKTVEAYTQASHQRDLKKYLGYWHKDFLG